MPRRHLCLSAASIAIAIACGAPTHAQTTDAAALDAVTVTAQRKTQNAQDVPISLGVVDGRVLETQNLRDPRDLALVTPGLSIQSATSASTAAIFIRGVGIGDFNANTTGAIGVYRDDVFINANSAKLIDLFDGESVEVLKGPQGTLYGRNTTGGAIRFNSRKPSDSFEADLVASYGRFDETILEGGVGGPILAERVKLRVAGLYDKRDGTTLNRVTGDKVNNLDLWAGRLIVDVTPTGDLLLRAIVHGGENHGGARQFQHRGQGFDLFGDPAILPDGTPLDGFGYADTDHDKDAGDYDHEGKDRVESLGASLMGQLSRGGVELTSLTAWERVDHRLLEDTDASPNDIVTGLYIDRPRQFSQELRLRSTGDRRLSWIAGGYYLDERLHNDSAFDVLRITRDPSLPLGGFDPAFGNGYQRYPYDQTTRSLAAFGQVDYRLTDRLTATGGLRYTRDRIGLDFRSYFDEPSGVYPLVAIDERRNYHDLSWRAALGWKTGETLLYASASKGYNSGGFPAGLANFPEQLSPFKPERLYAYEVGVKTSLADDRLRFDAASYYYDYRDLQVFVFDTSTVIPLQRKVNASDARIYGLEANVVARPSRRVDLSFGANLMRSEYRDFTSASAADYGGNDLVNAPRLQLTGSVAFTQPVGRGAILGRIDGMWQTRMFLNPDNATSNRVGAYGMANARLGWRLPNGVEIAGFVRNLTDTRAITYIAPVITLDEINYTDLRTYGVQLVVRIR